MMWKKAMTVGIWVLVAIVPGGLWAMGAYLALKAARAAQLSAGQTIRQSTPSPEPLRG